MIRTRRRARPELVRVAVAGHDHHRDPLVARLVGERGDHVVGLVALDLDVAVAERLHQRGQVRPLLLEQVGPAAALGLVVLGDLLAPGHAGVPHHDGRRLAIVGEDLHEHRGEAEDRVRRAPVGGRDRLGQREERPVGERVAVDQEQLTRRVSVGLGHAPPRLDEPRRAAMAVFPERPGAGRLRDPRPLTSVHFLPAAAALGFGAGLDAHDVDAAVPDAFPLRAALAWRPCRHAVGSRPRPRPCRSTPGPGGRRRGSHTRCRRPTAPRSTTTSCRSGDTPWSSSCMPPEPSPVHWTAPRWRRTRGRHERGGHEQPDRSHLHSPSVSVIRRPRIGAGPGPSTRRDLVAPGPAHQHFVAVTVMTVTLRPDEA